MRESGSWEPEAIPTLQHGRSQHLNESHTWTSFCSHLRLLGGAGADVTGGLGPSAARPAAMAIELLEQLIGLIEPPHHLH